MSTIVPAILPTSRDDLERKLAMLEGLTDSVQIDLVDGRFVSPPSWPYVQSETNNSGAVFSDADPLPYLGQIQYEMDLMVADPEAATDTWVGAGALRLTIHAESTTSLPKVLSNLQVKFGHAKDFVPDLISLGLAINIATEMSFIEPYLQDADYVQFMGIKSIGNQGEPFDDEVLRKISQFRHKYPDITIQIDGGVSLHTAPQLLAAGADRLIIGSALWKAQNLREEIEKFKELVQEAGMYSQ